MFKIRIAMLITSFLIIFFIIGIVENVLASWPGQCTHTVVMMESYTNWTGFHHAIYSVNINENGIILLGADTYKTGTSYGPNKIWTFYFENNSWHLQSESPCFNFWDNPLSIEHDAQVHDPSEISNILPSQCLINCDDEEAQLTQQCGGIESVKWEWTNTATCTGRCIPCTGNLLDGQETMEQATARCAGIDQPLLFYSTEQCAGICTGTNNGQPDHLNCSE